MIDSKTGRITIKQPTLVLDPAVTKTTLASSLCKGDSVRIHSKPPWTLFTLNNTLLDGDVFALTICFHGEHIEYLTLASRRPEFGRQFTELSQTSENARQAFHNQWLHRHLAGMVVCASHGPDMPAWTWNVPWGRIISGWDVKNGTAEIVIRYRQDGQVLASG